MVTFCLFICRKRNNAGLRNGGTKVSGKYNIYLVFLNVLDHFYGGGGGAEGEGEGLFVNK